MMLMILMMMFFSLITILLMNFNLLISNKLLKNREKMSPFECGFDPLSKSRMPFSIQFFMISLIFLIFDIEITLLFPLILLMYMYNYMYMILSLLFLIILIMGLMIEYMEKSIDWKI